jgi:hypothetical protein
MLASRVKTSRDGCGATILSICLTLPRHGLRGPHLHHQRGKVEMRKQWTLEMHYPSNGKDSLITTDNFNDFAEVEQKMKQNREMVFVVKPPADPLTEDLQMLDDLKRSGLKIERS